MVLLFACNNKKIDFTNQEEVCKAWTDWNNQSKENKEALVKNAIEFINAKKAECAAHQAKMDSIQAIVEEKLATIETLDVEAQKALLDEICTMTKPCCKAKCCSNDGEKKCNKDGEKKCEKSCEKKHDKEGEKKCCNGEKKCCKEKEECCKEWAEWDNQTTEKKAELIANAIEKFKTKREACANKKAEMETKKAEFDAKWATIESLDIEAQKTLIDEVLTNCCEKKCCHKKDGKKCDKDKEETIE